MIIAGENKVAKDQCMTDYFNSLSPISTRTQKSFTCRWAEMQAAYK